MTDSGAQTYEAFTCRDALLLIQAELDNEINAHETTLLAMHRATCRTCDETYGRLRRARDESGVVKARKPSRLLIEKKLREAALARGEYLLPPPPGVLAKSLDWVAAHLPTRTMILSAGLGAALTAAVAAYLIAPSLNSVAARVLESHRRAEQPGHLSDIATANAVAVRDYFVGKVEFEPPVKILNGEESSLIGGRLDYLDGHSAAVTVYRVNHHIVEVYCWPLKPAERDNPSEASAAQQDDVTLIHWRDPKFAIWIVSDLDEPTLTQFAGKWRPLKPIDPN